MGSRRETQDSGGSLDEQRDAHGEWWPTKPCAYAPLLEWPLKPKPLFKWLFGFPGFLWPYNVFHAALAWLTWRYLQPSLATASELRPGWVGLMLLRNVVLMLLVYGGLHLGLYTFKLHGTRRKYRKEWLDRTGKRFLFHDQLYDNMFRTLCLGGPIWTAYEVLYMWSAANGRAPYLSPSHHPVWFAALFLLIPLWRELHFYVIHRALHWRPLMRRVHRIHHLNYNPGPWSGMAMHWVELTVYLSVVLIHWVLPSHPVHFLFNAQLTALTPAYGHHGFEGPLFNGKFPTGSYFHYLHHRYVNCNYGEATLPLDRWFGSFQSGRRQPPGAIES